MNLNRRRLAFAGASALCAVAMGFATGASAQAAAPVQPAASAQSRTKTSAHARDQAAILAGVETYRKGLLTADRGLLEGICADQLSYGHSSGKVQSKAEFIAGAADPKSTWKYITLSDQSVAIIGSNAIVRNIFSGDIESEGKVTAIKIGILMVWQKQKGHWKLLARQAFKI